MAVVKPYRHAAGSWMVIMPKDVITQAGLEDSLKKGTKVAVYYDQKKKRLIYQLPADSPGSGSGP